MTSKLLARNAATIRRCLTSSAVNQYPRVGGSLPFQQRAPVLRMLMFGKPGAGKGTLSARLLEKYDINFMSAGDILRQQIAAETEVGQLAEGIVASGGLLPDDIMLELISSRLSNMRGKPWILDGFPRTLGQGELLDTHIMKVGSPLSLVIYLDVADDILRSRITDRWVHAPSGRVYNTSYNPPKIEGKDDITGEPLSKRPDDNPETFTRRLQAFYKRTSPLLDYYSQTSSAFFHARPQLVRLTGRTSDEIWPKLEGVVQKTFNLKIKSTSTQAIPEAVVRQTEQVIRGRRIAESTPI